MQHLTLVMHIGKYLAITPPPEQRGAASTANKIYAVALLGFFTFGVPVSVSTSIFR